MCIRDSTNNYQKADTGTKMIHLGKNTKSKIISKGISAGNADNTYRGLVDINKNKVSRCQFDLFVDWENGKFKAWSNAMIAAGYAYVLLDIFNSFHHHFYHLIKTSFSIHNYYPTLPSKLIPTNF